MRAVLLRLALFTLAALAMAGPARGAGINLSWSDCGIDGAMNRFFACSTDGGSGVLVASVIPPFPLPRMVGFQAELQLQVATYPLPPWWDLRSGVGCRSGALTMDVDFAATPSGGTVCADAFAGRGSGGTPVYTVGYCGLNRARIGIEWLLPEEVEMSTDETYLFRLRLGYAGTTACAGCLDPACIVFAGVRLLQAPGALGGSAEVVNAAYAQYVTWQGGGGLNCPLVVCGPVPARNATWGQIKSLYR